MGSCPEAHGTSPEGEILFLAVRIGVQRIYLGTVSDLNHSEVFRALFGEEAKCSLGIKRAREDKIVIWYLILGL